MSTTSSGTSPSSSAPARCESAPPSSGPSGNVAFENVDGSKVLVVHNGRRTPASFAVNVGGDRHFDVDDLPPDAIATYVW